MNICLQAVSTTIGKEKINNHVSLPVFMTKKRIFSEEQPTRINERSTC